MPEPDWTQAKCLQHDPELFFPPTGRAHKKQRQEAKAVCRGNSRQGLPECPVREACRDHALDAPFEATGIWGGLSDRERRRFSKDGLDPVCAGRQVTEDARPAADNKGRDKSRRTNRKNAAGGGRGAKPGREKAGRPSRKRTGETRVLPARRLPANHGCPTARGVSEVAASGDLRGRPRRPRQVAALGTTTRSTVRSVAVRGLRVAMDGDVA